MDSQSQMNQQQQLVPKTTLMEQPSLSLNEPAPSAFECTDEAPCISPINGNGNASVSSITDYIHKAHPSSDSMTTSICEHSYTGSSGTTVTIIGDCVDNSYLTLSPINKDQARRSKSYKSRYQYPKVFDNNSPVLYHIQHISRVGHVMTQCPTNSGTSSGDNNASNNMNNNGHNNDGNKASDNSGNGWNNRGGSGGNNNRGWKGRDGDDEKKRENHKNMDKYEDDIKDEEEEEEDDDGQDEFKSALYIPLDHNRSKSLNAVFNRQNKPCTRIYQSTVCPEHRAQGSITISKKLTETIIPQNVKENIQNVYDFMDKTTGIALLDGHILHMGNCKILNYGFHASSSSSSSSDSTYDEELFLVADERKNRRIRYEMRDSLYTKHQICDIFGVKECDLPRSFVDLERTNVKKVMKILGDILEDLRFYENEFANYNWNKLPVFRGMKGKKNFNKRRITFSLTKSEFFSSIKAFVCYERSRVIPIVMFSMDGYRVEYVHIVQIEKEKSNIDIGISYVFNPNKNCLEATGIHLDKDCILRQHQLIVPDHRCHCLDDFYCNIDDLHIGNCDDDKNRARALKNENSSLKKENKALKHEIEKLKRCSISGTPTAVTAPSLPLMIAPSPSVPLSLNPSLPPIIAPSQSTISPSFSFFSPHSILQQSSFPSIDPSTPWSSAQDPNYTPSSTISVTRFSEYPEVGYSPSSNHSNVIQNKRRKPINNHNHPGLLPSNVDDQGHNYNGDCNPISNSITPKDQKEQKQTNVSPNSRSQRQKEKYRKNNTRKKPY